MLCQESIIRGLGDVYKRQGLVVRTKLNQIIAALSTLSQGSGTPTSGLAAYTPFIDGNTLKIQNSSNDGQVTLGDVSATNFGHAGLSAANTFTSTNIFQEDVTFDGATAGRDIVFDTSSNEIIKCNFYSCCFVNCSKK